jgi:ligand-binding sensor domain-containing protein/signal transduction histidine kinase
MWGQAGSLALCLTVSGFATKLPLRSYTVADGLARDAALCIVPDSLGFLWVCTAEGLSRFDGYGFLNYGTAQGLPHRAVNAFLPTRPGVYLAGTDGGLARLDPTAPPGSARKFVALTAPIQINALLEDRTGTVWAGTVGGLFRVANPGAAHPGVEWESLGRPDPAIVSALAEDARGNIWAGTSEGLCRRAADGVKTCFAGSPGGLPAGFVKAMAVDRGGKLWVGTLAGLWRIAIDGAAPRVERKYGVRDGLASERIHSIFQSASGTLWVGTALALSELTGERFRNWGEPEGLSGRAVLAVNEDREGNLWAGVDHGLARIARDGFATFTEAEGVGKNSITELLERDGVVYAVSNETSSIVLHRYRDGRFDSVRPRYPPAIRYFGWGSSQSVLLDRAGEWWIATGEGLCRFPRVAFEQLAQTPPQAVYTARDGLPGNDIFRLFEDSRGDIWITSIGRAGPTRWERATGQLHRYSENEVPGYATAYAEDLAGNLWIGFSNDASTSKPCGLVRYRNGKFQRFDARDGVPAGWITDLFVDREGRLWIGSGDGGLGRVDDPAAQHPRLRLYTAAQGLSSISVRRIAEDRQGRIYAATARALDRLDPASGFIKHYSTADGLAAGAVAAILADSQGAMWFGSTMGLSRMTPSPQAEDAAPAVYITGLNINGEAYAVPDPGVLSLDLMRLEPHQRNVHIEFVGFGAALQYQYRLDGADGTWSAPLAQRSVNYASLAPGTYRFQVRAVSASGAARAAPAEVTFRIPPPLWRRAWFVSLLALGAAALGYGAHRYHLARRLELERIRMRIATDLHDDVGASLSRVAILSEIVNRQAGLAQSEPGQRLAEIAETARGLVDSMGDIVWAIDPRRDDMQSLLRRVRQLMSETLEPLGIAWGLDAPAELEGLSLTPDRRRNLFLMVKEAVYNAARHAHCARVTAAIEVKEGDCRVEVRDDGCGMPEPEPDTGNGLGNMRNRARTIGGTLAILPAPGGGTAIVLRFPMRRPHGHALLRGRRNAG